MLSSSQMLDELTIWLKGIPGEVREVVIDCMPGRAFCVKLKRIDEVSPYARSNARSTFQVTSEYSLTLTVALEAALTRQKQREQLNPGESNATIDR